MTRRSMRADEGGGASRERAASVLGQNVPQQQEEEEAGDGQRDRQRPTRPPRGSGRRGGARKVQVGRLPWAREQHLAEGGEVVARRTQLFRSGQQLDGLRRLGMGPALRPDEEQ